MQMRPLLLAFLLPLVLANTSSARTPQKAFPFSAEEDFDGARTVWFLLNASNVKKVKHAYVSAKDIPNSYRWIPLKKNESLQDMDMAWWPNAVAILKDKERGTYLFQNKEVSLQQLKSRFGEPVFRRFNAAQKPLALARFDAKKQASPKIPAILPGTDLYAAIFDLAINARGPRCRPDREKVVIGIADTDERRVYEIDDADCITGERRKVDPKFTEIIKRLKESGTFK